MKLYFYVSQMRIVTQLLLIGLLACGLAFYARMAPAAQQPGTVTVRPLRASQPGVPEVKVTVDRNRVPVGSEVVFALSPARVVADSRYRVTLFFGDGQRQVVRQAKVSHVYLQAGTYTYSVLVEAEKQSTPTPVLPVPNVKLSVSPIAVEVNRLVNFSARLSRRYPNLKYRFVFGDGSDTGWQDEPKATHSYRATNTFKAYVDIGTLSNGSINQAGGSERESIEVTEPPGSLTASATPRANTNNGTNSNGKANVTGNTNSNSLANTHSNLNANANRNANARGNSNSQLNSNANASPTASQNPPGGGNAASTDWWKYLIIVAIILFAGYQAFSYFFAPRPTFVPHFDPGESKVGDGKPLSIGLQIDVDPNIRNGDVRVDTQGSNLIKSKRTET